jgi:Carboxypeptidase regulatory-like domain
MWCSIGALTNNVVSIAALPSNFKGGGRASSQEDGMVMHVRKTYLAAVLVAGLFLHGALATAQVATGDVAGTVKDSQSGVIPGATVTLVSQTRGTTLDTTTNENGAFNFLNVPGDTYTVSVKMDGFKALERRGVPVSPGDRVSLGTLTIELGALSETVIVSGEAPMIQARSGERSFTVTTEAVQNLPVANRNYASLTSLAPGVAGTSPAGTLMRLGTVGQNSYQLDGVSTMEAGSNGQQLQLNVEAISEVNIVTQGYAAEYGRSSGLHISAVTKSGSNQLRGSVYDIRRDSDWNANTWANVRNGDPKAVSVQQDWGYTLGGPIGKPGGVNKLFFFYGHEFRPRTTGGGNPTRFTVPTALERAGDFSQSVDNNGAPANLIRDASTGLACSAADTRGCFQDGGVLGRIPASRLYPLGLNILKLWPTPNTSGLGYNYEVTPPTDKRQTHQPTLRADYQMSSKLRVTGKYAGQRATVKPTPGSIPGFNDTLSKRPTVTSISSTADYAFNSGMVLEGTWGFIRNFLGAPIVTQAGNRCNEGLCDLPFLFAGAQAIDPNSYGGGLLADIAPPYYVNGSLLLPPQFQWGSRIGNAPPNLIYPPFVGVNRMDDVTVSATKQAGRHTLKAGYFFEHSYKVQSLGQAAGAIPFQGAINFGNDTSNPIDSGFGYANAALGIFSSYGQQSKLIEGVYLFNSNEWYLQDNWKASNRLTLDYGLRFSHQEPQYDKNLQASNFFTNKWSLANAPQQYQPGCAVSASPCPSASRVAVNPLTGASLGANTGWAIGTLVPATGSLTNGLVQAGQGIAKENTTWPALTVAPRFGLAYDVNGDQHVVLRGSFGLFFDRPDGDAIFPQVGNPPVSSASTVRYSTLQSIGTGSAVSTPPVLNIFQYDAKVPSATQWNAGVQVQLPWATALDVSYVGNHGFNLLQNTQGRVGVFDTNAVDFGTAYLSQSQDTTLAASAVPGAAALPLDLLRPYRGYSTISTYMPVFHSMFHSVQTSLNRRYRNGLQFGVNYSYSISFTGNAGIATTATVGNPGVGLRLQHAADGSYSIRADQADYETLMKEMGNRPHTLKVNAVWSLPKVNAGSTALKAVGYVVNDWQVSGVLTAASAAKYDATFLYNSNGAPINLTGSSYNARIVIAGDHGAGCSDNQYKQFNTSSFSGPQYGSLGLESGRNVLAGCPDHTVDLAIARNIPVGKGRSAQFRVDLFNAFNTVVYSSVVTQLQLNSPTDQTVRNPQYNSDGTLNTARLLPKNAGFGAVNGAQAMRTVQVQLRFQF